MKIKKGFTLAEILITLVIIGVVAALTIPSVVVSYQKKQTVVQLEKVYKTLMQATNRAIADNGLPQTWNFNLSKKEFVYKYLYPYLNVSKDCNRDCHIAFKVKNSDGSFRMINTSSSHYYNFILSDGTQIAYYQYGQTGVMLAYVFIDLNGPKPPNISGKDVFLFMQYFYHYLPDTGNTNRYEFYGSRRDRNYLIDKCRASNSTNIDDGNSTCGALIMRDGWQIKDDYPW